MQEEIIRKKIDNIQLSDSEMKVGEFDFSISLVEENTGILKLNLLLPFPVEKCKDKLIKDISNVLKQDNLHVEIKILPDLKVKRVQRGIKTIPGVKNTIVVASGKGGVGKSTTSANLAIELSKLGAKVGLLDADLYGPSQTLMMGVRYQKPEQKEAFFLPIKTKDNIEVMSMGFLIDEKQAVIWRGPMISRALQQLLFATQWSSLDYLIIDLPPGTGDIQLTISQKIPVTAAVIVTTPQEIALIDASKAITMFNKVSIPVIGVIENMSYYICAKCGYKEPIFGDGGGKRMAEAENVELLGQIPLACQIREAMDTGEIKKLRDYSYIYQNIAWKLVLRMAKMANDFSHRFPEIVLEKE